MGQVRRGRPPRHADHDRHPGRERQQEGPRELPGHELLPGLWRDGDRPAGGSPVRGEEERHERSPLRGGVTADTAGPQADGAREPVAEAGRGRLRPPGQVPGSVEGRPPRVGQILVLLELQAPFPLGRDLHQPEPLQL